MSWILDKAENILNKIDQNAATTLPRISPSTGSVKEEGHIIQGGMTNSVESKEKLEWPVFPKIASSRSSISSKTESVAIDMERENKPESGGGTKMDLLKRPVTVPNSLSQMGSSSTPESQELAAFKIALSEVSNERDELRLRLSTLNRDIENAALKQRTQELESLAQHLTKERDQAQQELNDAHTTGSAYVHSISELETSLAKLQQEYLEVAQKLQMQMKETAQQRQELQEYRTKAQRSLQMKDSLIAELKASGASPTITSTSPGPTSDSEIRLLQMELDALKQEHQHMIDENRGMVVQLEETRRDWSALSKQHSEQLISERSKEDELRKELRFERERALAMESEQRVLSQELVTLRQQLSNEMAAAATRLHEKDQQLQQIQAQKLGKGGSKSRVDGPDESHDDNYDSRIKTLTKALVDKQNAVENITAERNALMLQLERVQDKLQQSMYSNNRIGNNPPRNALLSNSTDDLKAQFPILMKQNPFDTRVSRNVKRAYSSLDSAGIRLGAFLRRYPLMRIFVLMYVALLHIWVMFVLLSSTPN